MKDLIIFDLDGTLADTTDGLGLAMVQMLEKLKLPGRSREELCSFISYGARDFVCHCLPSGYCDGIDGSKKLDDACEMYLGFYLDSCDKDTFLYDGIYELLTKLKSEGYKMAVLSNKPYPFTAKIIQKLTPDMFDYVLGIVSEPPKPDPYCANLIAHKLGYSNENTIVIGDSTLDYLTAKNSNMKHICVTYGCRSEEELRAVGATNLVHSPNELYDAIKSLE